MKIKMLVAAFLAAVPSLVFAVSFSTFGDLIYDQNGQLVGTKGVLYGMSGDGRTIFGVNGTQYVVYRDGQEIPIPVAPLPEGAQLGDPRLWVQSVNSTSYDGSIMVGVEQRRIVNTIRGIIYQNGQATVINAPADIDVGPLKVSNDGSTIIGYERATSGPFDLPTNEVFKYQNGEFTPLGSLYEGDSWTFVNDISGDGSIIVGTSRDWTTLETAGFIYQHGQMREVPVPGDRYAYPKAISSDGSTIIGAFQGGADPSRNDFVYSGDELLELASWENNDLGSSANDISADGSIIVGVTNELLLSPLDPPSRKIATLWEADGEGGYTIQSLEDKLFLLGIDIADYGFAFLNSIRHISDDGTVLIGEGSFRRPDGRLGENLYFVVDLTSTTVPLPAAAWLFLSAVGGLLGFQRIKKVKSESHCHTNCV